jgi:hypothetical protein
MHKKGRVDTKGVFVFCVFLEGNCDG